METDLRTTVRLIPLSPSVKHCFQHAHQPCDILTYCVAQCIMYHMVNGVDREEVYENLALELRRGVLVLAVLSQMRQEQYGYSLKQTLDRHGLEINEGTLYPLLRRLEAQGLLTSDWRVEHGVRPRRYYTLSPAGKALLADLTAEWNALGKAIEHLLSGGAA